MADTKNIVGEKYKAGDFVFAHIFKDESIKVPFIVSHWSNDRYYVLGDGSHYVKEENLSPATEKDFVEYYGQDVSDSYINEFKKENGGSIEGGNADMVANQNKMIQHHASELEKILSEKNTHVPAWVVYLVSRSATDLSDATHFLDGVKEKMAKGGAMAVRNDFETYLNNLYDDELSDVNAALEKFDYLTSPKRQNHISKGFIIGHYQTATLGSLLKKYDPIAFNTMLNEQSGSYELGGNLDDKQEEIIDEQKVENFVEEVKDIRSQVKQIVLKDGTVIKGENLMEEGGSIDGVLKFHINDYNKLMDSREFDSYKNDITWSIKVADDTKVIGRYNTEKSYLYIIGKKDLSNPLVKWLKENSYLSSTDIEKLEDGGGVKSNNIFLLNDTDRIKYIHSVIINDPHFSGSKLNLKKFAENINVVIKNYLIHDRKNPIITKFGEAIYFEPHQRYINEDGFNKAHVKYATHFISGYVENAQKKDIRTFDKSKFDAIQLLIPSLLSPDVVRLYQKKDKKKNRREAIIYAKEISLDKVSCVILVTEITKEGEVRSITFFPKKVCGYIEKQKASGYWSDAFMTRFNEKQPSDETQTMSTGGSVRHNSNIKDNIIIDANTGDITAKYQIVNNQVVVDDEVITVDELYNRYMLPISKLEEGGGIDYIGETHIGGDKNERINQMVEGWNEEGIAFSHLNYDDSKFFETIGIPMGSVGITSQTGNDIVYYNTDIYDNDDDALRKRRKETNADGGEITAKYIGEDDWSRRLYKDGNGKIYADVDGVLHYITNEGEPLYPAINVKKIDPTGELSDADKFQNMMNDRDEQHADYIRRMKIQHPDLDWKNDGGGLEFDAKAKQHYISPEEAKKIKEVIDTKFNSEYPADKYVYKFNEERGEITAYVENMSDGETVWEFRYPDHDLPEEDRDSQSTPVDDGFMRHWDDVAGLETYLKSLNMLSNGDTLISESEANNKYNYYCDGGYMEEGGNVSARLDHLQSRLIYAKDFTPHKVPYYEQRIKELKEQNTVDYGFVKSKESYEEGESVMMKDTFGDFTIQTKIKDTINQDGFKLYLVEDGDGAYMADELKPVMFKRGGKIWIADALSGKKGALRTFAKRKGILHGKHDKLTVRDLHKLENMGGVTAKRAHLAETLSHFDDGGVIENQYEGKTNEQIWDMWNVDQRTHFLKDHRVEIPELNVRGDIKEIITLNVKEYNELPQSVKDAIGFHKNEGQYGKGGGISGNLSTTYTNPLEYLKAMGATINSDLNYSTKHNAINYYIGQKGNKSIVVAFIEDSHGTLIDETPYYIIDKEDAREMSLTAKTKGIESVELYTNYGIELHSENEKPQDVGFDKIYKVSVGEFSKGGGIEGDEFYLELYVNGKQRGTTDNMSFENAVQEAKKRMKGFSQITSDKNKQLPYSEIRVVNKKNDVVAYIIDRVLHKEGKSYMVKGGLIEDEVAFKAKAQTIFAKAATKAINSPQFKHLNKKAKEMLDEIENNAVKLKSKLKI